jgi:hypothetical protein
MMLMAASCPSNRLAAVTNLTGWAGRWSSVTCPRNPVVVRASGRTACLKITTTSYYLSTRGRTRFAASGRVAHQGRLRP